MIVRGIIKRDKDNDKVNLGMYYVGLCVLGELRLLYSKGEKMNYLLDLRKIVGTRPLIACGAGVAIVNRDNKLLMQRRADNGCWGLIGGMMELGESIQETVKREAFEEVGIILDKLDFFRVYSGRDFYYKYPNGDEVYNVINMFTVKYSKPLEIRIDNKEVKEARFFDFDKLPIHISPPDVKIIEDIIDFYQ